jgi:hypothetical protein
MVGMREIGKMKEIIWVAKKHSLGVRSITVLQIEPRSDQLYIF